MRPRQPRYPPSCTLLSDTALFRSDNSRTDVVYRMAPVRWEAALAAALDLMFFIPALTSFLWVSTEYAVDSWIQGERSNLSPWLPPVYPLKTVLPVSAALLLLQGVSEFIKSIYAAKGGRWE